MLGITRDDFVVRAQHFDLSQPWNLLRVVAGAFMFPHVAGKFAAGGLSAGVLGFFAKAGFQPPEFWVCLAALGAAGALAVAVYALHAVKGFGWLWNLGGYEYPVFWALVCVALSMNGFREQRAATA